eukprot:COSAG05_NODE_228_length_13388_cov_2.850403_9_plen_90_part_00
MRLADLRFVALLSSSTPHYYKHTKLLSSSTPYQNKKPSQSKSQSQRSVAANSKASINPCLKLKVCFISPTSTSAYRTVICDTHITVRYI